MPILVRSGIFASHASYANVERPIISSLMEANTASCSSDAKQRHQYLQGHCRFPVKLGFLFSRKAATPSFIS